MADKNEKNEEMLQEYLNDFLADCRPATEEEYQKLITETVQNEIESTPDFENMKNWYTTIEKLDDFGPIMAELGLTDRSWLDGHTSDDWQYLVNEPEQIIYDGKRVEREALKQLKEKFQLKSHS